MTDSASLVREQKIEKTAPQPIDVHIGRKILQRRTELGMCHRSLAKKIKSSEDTVKEYESGDSHMTSNEVYNMSQALKVNIGFLFS